MPRVCILVLSGLPASGKSTCARRLKASAKGRGTGRVRGHGDGSAHTQFPAAQLALNADGLFNQSAHEECIPSHNCFYHVAYDEIMPADIEGKLLNARNDCLASGKSIGEQESSQWRNYRKEIVKCVERHLMQYTLHEQRTGSFEENMQELPEPEIWERFLKLIEAEHVDRVTVRCKTAKVDRDIVYIIDDNMYYQSMRFQYYQLARKYTIGFAQLYFESSVELAQKRNSFRLSPVPSAVIATMATRLEPPGCTEPCDKHVLVIRTDQDEDDYIPAVLRLVSVAVKDPVPAVEVRDEGALQEARVTCSTNLIHQSDQALRQLLADTMAQAKVEGLEKKALKDLAAKMNGARQRLLGNMRQGCLLVQSGLNEEAHAGRLTDSALYKFVKTMLEHELEDTTES